jgi:hypothetical protein
MEKRYEDSRAEEGLVKPIGQVNAGSVANQIDEFFRFHSTRHCYLLLLRCLDTGIHEQKTWRVVADIASFQTLHCFA